MVTPVGIGIEMMLASIIKKKLNNERSGKLSTKHVITTTKGKKILADKKAENESIITYLAFLEI